MAAATTTSARAHHAAGLGQGAHAVVPLHEVVERAEKQHHVRRPVRVLEPACIAHARARQGGAGVSARLLDVPRRLIDEVDLVAAAGEPARVDAGAASDVEDTGRRRGQVSLEDVLRARELDHARPLEQASALEAGLVEPLDVVRVAHETSSVDARLRAPGGHRQRRLAASAAARKIRSPPWRCHVPCPRRLAASRSSSPSLAPPRPARAPPPAADGRGRARRPRSRTTCCAACAGARIGPYRGGRVVAVAGVRDQPYVYYFGGTGGGIWKTTDGGIRWTNVSDGQLGTGSVGAVAVAESDPNVVYAGMGEGCIRGNVSHGDGVYRSTDAGSTWTNVGLRDTRQIGRVRVHPQDPDLVYVAALGHAFGRNAERGVFRSRDGGKSWRKVLFVDDTTGAIDIAMDPDQPARPLRRVLAGGAHALEPGERRAGQRPLQDDGRRRHLEEDRGRGPAQGTVGPRRA